MLPVMYELSHEFEHGCCAGWNVIPQLYCSLEDWDVRWVAVPIELRTQTLYSTKEEGGERKEKKGKKKKSSSSISQKGYIQSKSIIKLVLALKAKAIPLRSLTKPTNVLWKETNTKY